MSDLHLYSVLDTFNSLTKVEEPAPAETVYENVEARGSITRAIKEADDKKKEEPHLGQNTGVQRGLTGDPEVDKLLTKVRTDYPAIAAKSDMAAVVKHISKVDDELDRAKTKEDELQTMLNQTQSMLAQNQENQDEMNNRFKELNAQIAAGEIDSKEAAKKAQDIDKDYQGKKKKVAPNAKVDYVPPTKGPVATKAKVPTQSKVSATPPKTATAPTAPSNVVPIRPTSDPFSGQSDDDTQGELKFGESVGDVLDLGPEENNIQPDPGVLARARWEEVRKAWWARQPEVSLTFPDRPNRPVTIRAPYMYALAWYFRETGKEQDELARIEKTLSSYSELQKIMNSAKLSHYLSVYPEFVKKDKVLKAARAKQRELRKRGQLDMFGNKLQEGVEALSKSLMEKFQNFKQEEVLLERELKDKEDFDKHAKTGDHYTTKSGNKVIKTKTGIKHEKVVKKSKDEKDDLDEAKEKPMNAFHPDFTKKQKEKEGTGKYDKFDTGYSKRYTKKDSKPDYIDLDDDGDKEEPMKKAAKDKKAKDKSKKKVKEASYSAKAARAGKDIGKPGKQFSKIAKDAAKRYGSKEKGEKVAGSILAKLRAGQPLDEEQLNEILPALAAIGGEALAGGAAAGAVEAGGLTGALTSAGGALGGEVAGGLGLGPTGTAISQAAGRAVGTAAANDVKNKIQKTIGDNVPGLNEKAVSKAQQKFMGMVYATKKGEKAPSSAVAKAAKGMSTKAAKDYAQTKHKGLPQHVGEGVEFTDTVKNSTPKMKKITVKESVDTLRKQPIYTTQEAWDHYAQELEEEKMKSAAEADAPIMDAQVELDEIARLAGLPAKAKQPTCETCGCEHGELEECGGTPMLTTPESLDEMEMEEGNEFSGALAAAKAAGQKEFEVDGKKYTVKEDINMNVTANGEEDVVNLIRKLSGMPVLAIQTPTMGEEVAEDAVVNTLEGGPTEREIEHTNTPREEVAGLNAADPDGGDLNRAKKQFKKEYPGDNPMAVKEAALWKAYESMLKDVKG